jgi:hypothetical protein
MTNDIIYGTVFKNGTATLLARIVGRNDAAIVSAEITQVLYTVYLLDDDDPDSRQAVAGHEGVALDVATVVFDQLQTDALWNVDAVGYNFCHTLDVSAQPAFPIAGRRYLIEHQLTPAAGQVILTRFRVNAI